MNGVSTQRPNLKPTERSVPVGSKPKRRCRAIEPAFSLSPMIAIIWRQGPASQRAIKAPSSAAPTPRPPRPFAT